VLSKLGLSLFVRFRIVLPSVVFYSLIMRGRRRRQSIMQKIIASSLLVAGFSTPTFSQDTPSTSIELPDTLVTATRSETARNQLATASTVYTRKDIDRLQVKTVPELLRGSAGIDITQTGGYGKNSSVFMRGTNSDHILVLIDGIKVGSATTGTSPFEFIPLDQVERVEITRGPNSSLYGSEAIGGVIQIFTRKGEQKRKAQYRDRCRWRFL